MTRTDAAAARNMHSDADWSLDIRRADALRLTGEKVREVAATLPPALAAKADICIAAADKPYQLSSTDADPASETVCQIFPHGLAIRTFFAIPKQKNATPRANFSTV